MNRKQLIERVASGCDIKKSVAADMLDFLGSVAMVELSSGGEIPLPHIGKLHVERRAARKGRNPRTGEAMDIPARAVVKLSVAGELKQAIART